jgi:hypothetical protein
MCGFDMPMIRIAYVSVADAVLDDAMVDEIVRQARDNNANLAVTGCLVFNGVNFAQVLEGEQDIVEMLLESIINDDRHRGVIMVARTVISERNWPDWGMVRLNNQDFDTLFEIMRVQ